MKASNWAMGIIIVGLCIVLAIWGTLVIGQNITAKTPYVSILEVSGNTVTGAPTLDVVFSDEEIEDILIKDVSYTRDPVYIMRLFRPGELYAMTCRISTELYQELSEASVGTQVLVTYTFSSSFTQWVASGYRTCERVVILG